VFPTLKIPVVWGDNGVNEHDQKGSQRFLKSSKMSASVNDRAENPIGTE